MLAVILALCVPLSASASLLTSANNSYLPSTVNPADNFGETCAKDGTTIVVGCPLGAGHTTHSGTAYVYVASSSTWVRQATLMAPTGANSDYFGRSVAIDGDTIVIGAPGRDHAGATDAGAAYVFKRSGSTWTYKAELKAVDRDSSDSFGASVGIDGGSIIVGAPLDEQKAAGAGSAYAFALAGSVWTQQYKMTAADAQFGDQFGRSVAIFGSRAVIAAIEEDGKGTDAGAAYIFERSGLVWSQKDQLRATDGAAGDAMGSAVAISGSTVVLGAPGKAFNNDRNGKAYVFTRKLIAPPSTFDWVQQAKLSASDGALGDQFGTSVDVDGYRAVIGSPMSDPMGFDSGSVYTYNRSGSTWVERFKVVGAGSAEGDRFGRSVAIADNALAIGSPGDDNGGDNRGNLYVAAVPNVAPTAVSDSYTVTSGSKRTVSAPGVLSNDYDDDFDPITAYKSISPSHGTLSLRTDGGFTYTPAPGYFGTDSFWYKATDGRLSSPQAKKVTLVVTDTAAPHVTRSSVYSADLTKVTILASDSGSGVKHIEYKIDGSASTTVVAGASATISFTKRGFTKLQYRARDNAGRTSFWATVMVRVKYTALSLDALSPCAYRSGKLTGFLGYADTTGTIVPLAGQKVAIQYYSAGSWKYLVQATTSATGTFTLPVKPKAKTTYRARFTKTPTYLAGASPNRTVKPRVSLARPSFGRSTLNFGTAYTVYGNLKPRHKAGTRQIKVKAYLEVGGAYVLKKTYTARVSNKASYSRYRKSIKLPSRGKWRLRVYHANDSTNAKTYSAYRYVRVR